MLTSLVDHSLLPNCCTLFAGTNLGGNCTFTLSSLLWIVLQEGGIEGIIPVVTLEAVILLEAVTLLEIESFPLKKWTLEMIPQLEMTLQLTLQLQFPPLVALQFQTLPL